MSDTLMICDFVASMRHAGYLSFAAAALGLAEAHYPDLRNAVRRATAWLVSTWAGVMRRPSAGPRRPLSAERCV